MQRRMCKEVQLRNVSNPSHLLALVTHSTCIHTTHQCPPLQPIRQPPRVIPTTAACMLIAAPNNNKPHVRFLQITCYARCLLPLLPVTYCIVHSCNNQPPHLVTPHAAPHHSQMVLAPVYCHDECPWCPFQIFTTENSVASKPLAALMAQSECLGLTHFYLCSALLIV